MSSGWSYLYLPHLTQNKNRNQLTKKNVKDSRTLAKKEMKTDKAVALTQQSKLKKIFN